MGYYPRRRVMVGKMFGNVQMSVTLTRNNCPSDTKPTQATYTVPADTYKAKTQLAANNLAQADLNANGQTYANTYGSCLVKTIGPWTLRATPADNSWQSVCYGNGMFVAVANSGTGNRVMTSPNGFDWTLRSSAGDYLWNSVCYGNGLFVAGAGSPYAGTGYTMVSSNGIDWTLYATTYPISEVCFGNGKFVAVSQLQPANVNNIMYSTDGANWTLCTVPTSIRWFSVCYGDGKFVAIGDMGYLAHSTDGINWNVYTGTGLGAYYRVCYGNGKFVATQYNSNLSRYSTDGINWADAGVPVSNSSVCFGDGLFVTVGGAPAVGNRATSSSDGVNWTISPSNFYQQFRSVCYNNGLFVAVASGVSSGGGAGNRVMTANWGF